MSEIGQPGPAWRMSEVLQIAAASDLADPAARQALLAKFGEFNAKLSQAAG